MNILNAALSGLSASLPESALTPATGFAQAAAVPATSAASAVPSRDSAIADIADISASVNGLQQAASSTASASSDEPLLDLPPLPAMPAPTPAPAVATDDHGQSNIVFADSDSDGALIH